MTTIIHALLLAFMMAGVNGLYCQPYNCYELLQISNSATPQQIKKAFRLMARRHHPDKNKQQDTTQLFQKINIAYEILDNEYTRKTYDAFLQDPTGSRAYYAYKYYQASYSPQVNPFLVLFVLFVLLSWLQWVMRKQMYSSAVQSIVRSEDFKKKVNQQCIADGRKGDKAYKEEVAERLESQISIQGGYSQPKVEDLLLVRIVLLPITITLAVKSAARWVWKYWIKREDYDEKDQNQLTRRALKVSKAQWESIPPQAKTQYISRRLWVSSNMKQYRDQMQQKQLEQLKQTNPAKYRKIMSYLKKQQ